MRPQKVEPRTAGWSSKSCRNKPRGASSRGAESPLVGGVRGPKCCLRLAKNDGTSSPAMRDNIRLVSSEGTGFTYYTTKNKKKQQGKLELKKYDPVLRRHVVFKEVKMPPHSK